MVDGTIAAPTGPAAVSDPEAVLRGLAHVFRQIAERASLGWQLYRVAAATDPQVAADRAELERLRRNTLAGAISRIDESALRPGLTRDDAVDTGPGGGEPAEPRDARRRRWSGLDSYERWVARTLAAALLPDPTDPTGPR